MVEGTDFSASPVRSLAAHFSQRQFSLLPLQASLVFMQGVVLEESKSDLRRDNIARPGQLLFVEPADPIPNASLATIPRRESGCFV